MAVTANSQGPATVPVLRRATQLNITTMEANVSAYDCRTRRESNSPNASFINRHEYDHISGWCAWGCGCRIDGRVLKLKSGEEIHPGRTMTPDDEAKFRAYAYAENDKKRPARQAHAAPLKQAA